MTLYYNLLQNAKKNGIFPGAEGRATLESDPSNVPAPSGNVPFSCHSLMGLDSINSTGENPTTLILPEALSDAGLGSDSDSFPPSGGLVIPNIVNYDTFLSGSALPVSTSTAIIEKFSNYENEGSALPASTFTAIIENFSKHKDKLAGTPCIFLHLRNKKDRSEAIYKFNPKLSSRYFPEGRAIIQESIRQRLGSEVGTGVFLSLTVAASDWDIEAAWAVMWGRFKRFSDALNVYRRRHMNAEHSLLYLAALEPFKSGYPHMHVFYPGLRWIIKENDLYKMDEWWGMGSARTEKEHREESAQSYILKYISKLEGWSEPAMAMLWHHRLRLYNLSHRFYKKAQDPGWEMVARYNTIEEMKKKLNISDSDVEKIIDTWKNLIPIDFS